MELKTYRLWKAGLINNGDHPWAGKPIFMGKMEGVDFQDAVTNYVKSLPPQSQGLYCIRNGKWYYCAVCLICETYEEANENGAKA